MWSRSRKPACFDTLADWHYWLEAGIGKSSPCASCTPQYKERMCAVKRCQRPEVVFVVIPNSGDLVGITSDHRDYSRYIKGDMGTALRVYPWPENTKPWRARIRVALSYACRPAQYEMKRWLNGPEKDRSAQ